jgi:hypothetical protein
MLALVSQSGNVVRSIRELEDTLFDVFRAATKNDPDA